jgi:fucose 4-O-acetylase-like acetyltransferase
VLVQANGSISDFGWWPSARSSTFGIPIGYAGQPHPFLLDTRFVEAAQTIPFEPPLATREKPRLEFIDNLRWVMIVLVVSMHAAVTYSHLGSWYFMEDPQPPQAVQVVFAAYQMFLQAFFMGLLFLIAGYFVPAAFDRKGLSHFLRDRALRLGVPSLLYMLLIHPITVYWLLREFAHPSWPSLAKAYVPYLTSTRFLSGSGPMWFALALLLFSAVYAVYRKLNPKSHSPKHEALLPTNTQTIGLVVAIGLCTFLVRIWQPIGTNILNMQLCFFSQYVLLFMMGIQAWRRDWFRRIPYRFGMRWLTASFIAGSLVWLGIILAALATHTEPRLFGGWSWQSAALSLWESFFCVGVCLGLIVLFRDKFNRQGKLARWLSDNCFSVYVFHPPLLIAVTLAMRGLDAPKLAKFLLATVLGVAVSYAASSLVFRRIPLLKRFL